DPSLRMIFGENCSRFPDHARTPKARTGPGERYIEGEVGNVSRRHPSRAAGLLSGRPLRAGPVGGRLRMTEHKNANAPGRAQSAVRFAVIPAGDRAEAGKALRAASRPRWRAGAHHRSVAPPAERLRRPAQSAEAK